MNSTSQSMNTSSDIEDLIRDLIMEDKFKAKYTKRQRSIFCKNMYYKLSKFIEEKEQQIVILEEKIENYQRAYNALLDRKWSVVCADVFVRAIWVCWNLWVIYGFIQKLNKCEELVSPELMSLHGTFQEAPQEEYQGDFQEGFQDTYQEGFQYSYQEAAPVSYQEIYQDTYQETYQDIYQEIYQEAFQSMFRYQQGFRSRFRYRGIIPSTDLQVWQPPIM